MTSKFAVVDYVREMTSKKACKCGEYAPQFVGSVNIVMERNKSGFT